MSNYGGQTPAHQSMDAYHKDIDAVVIQFMNTTHLKGYQLNLLQIAHSRVLKIIRNAANL